jgi:hypothetical protein
MKMVQLELISHVSKALDGYRTFDLTECVHRTGSKPLGVGGFGEVWEGTMKQDEVVLRVR